MSISITPYSFPCLLYSLLPTLPHPTPITRQPQVCFLFVFVCFLNFYSAVLVSAIQRHESTIIIHTAPPSRTSLLPPIAPPRWSQRSAWPGSLCYTAASHQLSILHVKVCMLLLPSPFVPLSPPLTVFLNATGLKKLRNFQVFSQKKWTQARICTQMSLAALSVIAPNWRQLRCPWTEEWMNGL